MKLNNNQQSNDPSTDSRYKEPSVLDASRPLYYNTNLDHARELSIADRLFIAACVVAGIAAIVVLYIIVFTK